jgi:C-terminal processing protease CtpA/Prc
MRICLALALAFAAVRPVHADELPDRIERVAAAGELWAEIKFFHPYLAYKPIDWDAAFVAALPKLEAATTKDAYQKALAELLAKLGDPVTRIREAKPPVPPSQPAGDWLTTPAPNLVLVDLAGFTAGGWDYVGFQARTRQVSEAASKAKVLVIDARAPEPQLARQAIELFEDALPAIDSWPLERTIEHHGYRSQQSGPAGAYYSAFVTTGAKPAKPAGKSIVHVVVIADARTEVAPAILALQAQGRATIVAPGPIAEENVVTTTEHEVVPGITVQLRLGESLSGPPVTDVRAPVAELRARALATAKTKLAAGAVAQPKPPANLPQLSPRNDNEYATAAYPSRELRQFAAIRTWAVLDRFLPYRYLVPDWDKALRDVLPKLEAATDADSYLLALKELGARSGDGHVGVFHPAAGATRATAAIVPRLVEGKLAVIRVIDPADASGLAVGDQIDSIDGRPTATVLAEKRRTISGSTDDARDQRTAAQILYGADNSTVKLGVRGKDRKLREVTLTRKVSLFEQVWKPTITSPSWKLLANNVGYVDLMRLTVPEVDKMFGDLARTKAIVFDLRGYPKGTAWSIAPRINVKGAKYGAEFLRPYVVPLTAGTEMMDQRTRFLQPIPRLPAGASIYKGKIVVLIDDRAISQSEHTCLFFQETAGATFIGSPTHGANGDVTFARLPGGLRMSFTGQEVKHADGKQLQRIGILPHIAIRPTLAGVRAGKDELLDRALAFVATGK